MEEIKIRNSDIGVDKFVAEDLEIINGYLTPSPQCDLCKATEIAYNINKDYSEGIKLFALVKKYNNKFKRSTGHNLTFRILSYHFTNHFNFKGAAVATYNQLMSDEVITQDRSMKTIEATDALQNLFNIAKDKYINDIEILDLTTKGLLSQLNELELLKQNKIEQNPTFNPQGIILQQQNILQSLYTNALAKIKVFQKGKLQQAKINKMETYNLLGAINSDLTNDTYEAISHEVLEETQKMFVKIIIQEVVEVLLAVMGDNDYTPEQKAIFFKSFQKKLKGVEKKIFEKFTNYTNETFSKHKKGGENNYE